MLIIIKISKEGENMGKNIARVIISLTGAIIGSIVASLLLDVLDLQKKVLPITGFLFNIIGFVSFGIILFLLAPSIINYLSKYTDKIESRLQRVPMQDIILGSFGLIIGLIIAFLLLYPLRLIPMKWVSDIISVVVYLLLGYLGLSIAVKRKEEINLSSLFKKNSSSSNKDNAKSIRPKILDTSVIIDGRIFDICKTGFIEGPLVIPTFVLQELRHIADSSDALKRNRGRRGLDILNKIQKELDMKVQINETDLGNMEVDIKLLKLGQLLNGKVITNDYNLNKVAEFQGVEVLNINELANAVKPVVLPGEEMVVQIIKDGKEMGQGIAYLDDGTMIVVDGGKKHVGEIMDVMVTSVLQTAAGRMIFAKQKSVDKAV